MNPKHLKTRTYNYGDSYEAIQLSKDLSGLEYLQGMQKGEIPEAPAVTTLDIKINEVDFGKANFEFIAQDFHYNAVGTVHGGVIATILDTAMGCTLMTTLTKEVTFTTLELKVNFIKAVTLKSGNMIAKGKIIHAGRTTAMVEATLVDESGKVYAHATSTCLIMNKR
nr:PaaI family thioesterase [uncultured Flavobacterium sp.]